MDVGVREAAACAKPAVSTVTIFAARKHWKGTLLGLCGIVAVLVMTVEIRSSWFQSRVLAHLSRHG